MTANREFTRVIGYNEDREAEELMERISIHNETQNDNNELHMYDSVEMQDDGSFFF